MKKIMILAISFVLIISGLVIVSATSQAAPLSLIVYGHVTYNGSYADGITVTVTDITRNTNTTTTTYDGGKYQVDISNLPGSNWTTGDTIKVNSSYIDKSTDSSFIITSTIEGTAMKLVNLVLSEATETGHHNHGGNGDRTITGSTDQSTGMILGASILILTFFLLILYLAFGNTSATKYKPPMQRTRGKKRKRTNKKEYVSHGVEMEEYSRRKKGKIKW